MGKEDFGSGYENNKPHCGLGLVVFGCHVAFYPAKTRLWRGLGGLWMPWYGLSSLNSLWGGLGGFWMSWYGVYSFSVRM